MLFVCLFECVEAELPNVCRGTTSPSLSGEAAAAGRRGRRPGGGEAGAGGPRHLDEAAFGGRGGYVQDRDLGDKSFSVFQDWLAVMGTGERKLVKSGKLEHRPQSLSTTGELSRRLVEEGGKVIQTETALGRFRQVLNCA